MRNEENNWLGVFEEARPHLMGLAYRILGTVAEAEDVVQDTFIKWQNAEKGQIKTPKAWLTTVCTRGALDLLKSAHKDRVSYVGTWLPEPLYTDVQDAEFPYNSTELASSLTTAFLLVLERLSPKERAAYLLYDVFENSYADVAGILDAEETAVRKLVSRARGHIKAEKTRYKPDTDRQEQLLKAFQGAIISGDTDNLGKLLAADAELHADSGGKVISISRALTERGHILKFIRSVLHPAWQGSSVETVYLNGQMALVFRLNGKIHTAVSFAYDEEEVSNLYLVRNPDKLARLEDRLSS